MRNATGNRSPQDPAGRSRQRNTDRRVRGLEVWSPTGSPGHWVALLLLGVVALLGSALSIESAPAFSVPVQGGSYQQIRDLAERYYDEGSYSLAREHYELAADLDLDDTERRWLEFRLADTSWRAQAGSGTADSTTFDRARQQLEALIAAVSREEDRDLIWAEAHESLGDFWWARGDSRNWGPGWAHYQPALDWWAGSHDIDEARDRYIGIVWKIAEPPDSQQYYYYGYYGNIVPVEIIDNVLDIAANDEDRARAHFLLAMTLRQQGGSWEALRRIPEEFEAALEIGAGTGWRDDALYHYANWLASNGRVVRTMGAQWSYEPDYVRAIELYRQILAEFRKGETRYYDEAVQQIENITGPTVAVSTGNFFLPGSEIQFYLSWRNVARVDLKLYRIELDRSADFAQFSDLGSSQWLQAVDLAAASGPVLSWSVETEDDGLHKPGQRAIELDEPLPLGAYVLLATDAEAAAQQAVSAPVPTIPATATPASGRELILVTDASLVLKTAGTQALIYFCDTFDGSPLANAGVSLWERSYQNGDWVWRHLSGRTGEDGIATFRLSRTSNNLDLFAAAARDDHEAFSAGSSYQYGRTHDAWRIYAFTDRAAYRPGEEARWKLIARQYDGSVYSTPSNRSIYYEIFDPRGTKVDEKEVALNAFGSSWGSLELTDTMPLGEYRVTFRERNGGSHIGDATLLRLEEYKLPEFKVAVSTPEQEGRKQAFRLGEEVEVEIESEYYFGGAVADATVEVLVYQNPFYHWWRPQREFAWYYDDIDPRYNGYNQGGGQVIKRETLTTDAEGKATLTFETPANGGQDFEYRIEARVTDASRREIIGSGTVRVTRQRYYVYSQPRHQIYRPQDQVEIDFKALDANEQPMRVTGIVKVTRDRWQEIWVDSAGNEVTGEELRALQRANPGFPQVGNRRWELKYRGYEHEDVLTRSINTSDEGEAELFFTPESEGYYSVSFSSEDGDDAPVVAQTAVWVATNSTTELGYRHGGLGIIVDSDTFRVGQTAAVMLTAPTSDRYVLFSVEGEDLYSYELVHLTGTVKLVEIDLEERHVPNIYLAGTMVADHQIYADVKQVVVPPTRNFLDVEVSADREQYQPGEEGTLTVRVRDHQGRPVAAEVALGLVDESTFYIQSDYAADPRQYFFGRKRSHVVWNGSSFQQKRYADLVEGDEGQLVDRRDVQRQVAVVGGMDNERREQDLYAANRAVGFASKSVVAEGEVGGRYAAADAIMPMSEEMVAAPAPGLAGGGQQQAVQVRSDFRSTALWQPDVITGDDGTATVRLTYPDSLTTWRATARVATMSSEFGTSTSSTRTQKPLIVRLQAPRFFVVGDTATISAVLNNNTDAAMAVTPSLDVAGVTVVSTAASRAQVPAGGEARLDWVVSVSEPGPVRLAVGGRAGEHSDGMERSFIAHDHGIEKLVAAAGKLRGDEVIVSLGLPAARRQGSTHMMVQVAPSMAVTMLDALPYLIDYPYGCTEQTMSRFLPAVITAKTLGDLGLEPADVMGRVFGGIEREFVEDTQRRGQRDLQQLDEMVRQGLDRLYDFQHDDGGWGWWKEGDSDHFMSAYVVWGLTLARHAGVTVREDALARGVHFLELEIVEEESNHDIQAWMLHALSAYSESTVRQGVSYPWEFPLGRTFDNLWASRDRLNAYTRALLALSAHQLGLADQAMTLVRNLENGVTRDDSPDTSVIQRGGGVSRQSVMGTAHWGEDGIWWRWSDGGIEATSFALRALLMIDPGNELIEPVTNWLIKNRRGAQWSNTRDTAITIFALNDYLRVSGELDTDLEYELLVNGQSVARRRVSGDQILRAPSQFVIDDELIADGDNEIRIVRRDGEGPMYFSAQATFFSLEEPVTAAGNEIFVRRQYYKLVGRETLLKGFTYERRPVSEGEALTSGQRVEVVITIEAKNNYEYLVFEDHKPAGLEAVRIRSGEPVYARELKSGTIEAGAAMVGDSGQAGGAGLSGGTGPDEGTSLLDGGREGADYTGRSRWVYQELRDRKVALFVDKLPEGFWEIRYDLRAEVPGEFHALPIVGHAMYVPDIRANGRELVIRVVDAG